MAHDYLVVSWQGLLQYISKNLVGKGYYYWHLTELPIHKKSKWGKIDEKLINKYQTNIDKFKRHRRKAKGLANFRYIRWEQYAFIFHTEGAVPDVYDDDFSDIRHRPIFLKISDETAFDIQLAGNGKAHIKLNSETYQGFKAMLHNVAKRQNPGLLQKTFKMINGFPSYAGVLKQKKQLRQYAVNQSIKQQIKVNTKDGKKRNMQLKDFWIYSKSPTIKVFSDTKDGDALT